MADDTPPPFRVAFLGPQASFSHQAALQLFPYINGQQIVKLLAQPSIPSLFTAISSGTVDLSIVPVENSTNGPVVPALDLISSASRPHQLEACGETSVHVRPCLAGRRRGWKAGSQLESKSIAVDTSTMTQDKIDLSHVTSLHTHPQAWSQCTPFLTQHFGPNVLRQNEDSTSGSAELVANDETGTSAAICSRLAADLFGLDILANEIQSESGNETRFLVLRRREHPLEVPILKAVSGPSVLRHSLLTCKLSSPTTSKENVDAAVTAAGFQRSKIYTTKAMEEWAFVFAWDDNDLQSKMEQLQQSLHAAGFEAWDWGNWTGI